MGLLFTIQNLPKDQIDTLVSFDNIDGAVCPIPLFIVTKRISKLSRRTIPYMLSHFNPRNTI